MREKKNLERGGFGDLRVWLFFFGGEEGCWEVGDEEIEGRGDEGMRK